MKDIEWLMKQAVSIVRNAGRLLSCREMAERIKKKGKTDFVTEADIRVQAQIKTALFNLDPSIQFVGEEQDNVCVNGENPVWILDPVDGTTNLIHNFRHSAISLALAQGDTVLAGIIYDPFADELFHARLGKGAFCNGEAIHVSDSSAVSDSLCSVGTNPGHRDRTDLTFQRMRTIYDRCHDIRRIGAASVELCYVACGRLDCYLEHSLKPWDYAAGKLLVEEAGGKITDFAGKKVSLGLSACDILASNNAIHRELLSML